MPLQSCSWNTTWHVMVCDCAKVKYLTKIMWQSYRLLAKVCLILNTNSAYTSNMLSSYRPGVGSKSNRQLEVFRKLLDQMGRVREYQMQGSLVFSSESWKLHGYLPLVYFYGRTKEGIYGSTYTVQRLGVTWRSTREIW